MRKQTGLAVAFVGIMLLLCGREPAPAMAAEGIESLRIDIEALKAGQKAIRDDLQAIKGLLRPQAPARPALQNVTVNTDDDPYRGDKNAPLTLVEFSDYQCPFCGRHVKDTLPKLETDYIKTGKVKYIFRDFPLESIHKEAAAAAEAANCAGDQGKYWEMHGHLFANQRAIALAAFSDDAKTLGLDVATFEACMKNGKYTEEVKKDVADGMQIGITGTPTFFLARTDPASLQIKGATALVGAQPYAAFKEAIDALLSPPAPAPPIPPSPPSGLAPSPVH
jgi:protein-disulfide isomerase